MTIIDTHIHEWSPARARLAVRRGAHETLHWPHSMADLTACIDGDVAGIVLVSTDQDSERENAALARLAADHDIVVATIGHLNLHGADFDRQLQRASADDPCFRGIRYTLRSHLDGPWSGAATANARQLGTAGFLLEILASPAQLPEVAGIAASIPDTSVVVDHIATAPASTSDVASWFEALALVAARPNVTAKLSNFEVLPSPAFVAPDVVEQCRRIVDLFGPERLMFASNWPVCLRRASYADTVQAMATVLDGMPTDARESIMYRTAARVFDVKMPPAIEEINV